jgi:hypothetical protein
MTVSSLACAKPEARRLHSHSVLGFLHSASGAEDASFDKPSEFAGAHSRIKWALK